MNCVYGRGGNFLFKSKFILTGIVGIYTDNNFDTVDFNTINWGCGFNVIKYGIVIGCSYTNREFFSVKVGFSPQSLKEK